MSMHGYARVPPRGRTHDAQRKALRAAGCTRVTCETLADAATDRPRLRDVIGRLGIGDVLVVTRLDRIARSTRDLLEILDTIAAKSAGFRSLRESWADTTPPKGGPAMTILCGLAAFERELLRDRTGQGRARAKARGLHLGRPPALTSRQRAEALDLLGSGAATQADLARRYGVSQSTISRLARKTAPALAAATRLDAGTRRAARAFLDRLEGKYAVTDAILYGSRARGDHRSDSDADIAVVLQGKPSKRARTEAAVEWAGIAFDVLMETGVKVNGFPFWAAEFAHPERFSNPPLIHNILRDGVHL